MKVAASLLLLMAAVAPFDSFRRERGVTPAAAGLNRLDVDLVLLSGAQPDLRDLRFYDRAQQEVPYLLVPPAASEAKWVAGNTLPLVPTKVSSGFEVDLGTAAAVDALRFSGLSAPFLKHVTIEGSGDRERWSQLSDTTVFDLPADQLRRRDVEFAPGRFRYLRVTWDDRSSARPGAASVSARVYGTSVAAAPLRAAVPFRIRPTERGRSRFRVDLPARGMAVEALELAVSNVDVYRNATVTEPRLDGEEIAPVTLGMATLRQTHRNGMTASQLVIPIARPQSRELEIAIDDGDNPPLAVSSVVLRFAPQPAILFESADGAPLTARYGDDSLSAPKYDVEAARDVLARQTPVGARWSGDAAPLQAKTAPAEVTFEGAPIDAGAFRFARSVAMSPGGLTLLPLDADVLARSSELRDVRLVDARNQQVPYVMERRAAPLVVKLIVGPRVQRGRNASEYTIRLPHPATSGSRLVLTTSSRVFSRRVDLLQAEDPSRGLEERLTTTATWRSGDAAEPAVPLTFEVPRDTTSLQIRVDEGDNAPLPIASAELQMPAWALRFFSPGTALRLVYGNSSAEAPRYDIELLAPRLFSEPAREVALTTAAPEPAAEPQNEKRFFWIAIGIVALVLLVLVARLLAPLLREETRPLL